MGESAEGKGLGRGYGKVWVRIGGWLGTLGVGGIFWDFGVFFFWGGVGKLGWETGLSKAYPLSPG